MVSSFLMHILDELRKCLNMDINEIKSVEGGLEIYKATLIEYTDALFNALRNDIVNTLQEQTIEEVVNTLRKIINEIEEIIQELTLKNISLNNYC